MNVPRPLLVVVIVIIVLGVIACGAGVIRGRMDAAESPQPTASIQFKDFADSGVPPRDVKASPDDCAPAGAVITISGSCVLTVDPQSLRPRSLRLHAIGGTTHILVQQKIRGDIKQSDPLSLGVGDEDAKISVAGTSPVTVFLSCSGSCQVRIVG